MSLFKTKNVWCTNCEDDEYFDQNSMLVTPLNSDADFIITGSHSGVLRIFKPVLEMRETVLETGYKASDLILEKSFEFPILQLGAGQLVSGSQLKQLAILHPKQIGVYSMVIKEGIADHGIQYMLKLMYSHTLKRSSANFILGHFGGTLSRDFICVQSLDGLLSFYEQESYSFSCFISVFLIPGPLVYLKKTDCFITSGSNWFIQCFKYKKLYDAGHGSPDEENAGKSILSDWDFQLNEPVLDLNVLELPAIKEFVILILGEKNLYCLNEGGKLKFMKRLDYSPICFTSYVLDNKIMTIIVSETSTVLIYNNTMLKWSAKLHFTPISIKRANLWNIKGCLVILSEDGKLECCYLGTKPSLFVAPPLSYQELDFEKAEEELIKLSKITKDLNNDELRLNNDTDKQLSINVTIDPELKTCKHEHNLSIALNNQMCSLSIELNPRGNFEELQVAILVQKPLKCVPQLFFYNNFNVKTQCECDIFLDETNEVPSLKCEIVVTSISESGTPRNFNKLVILPLGLVVKFCNPQKDAEVKLNLNLNRNAVPAAVLFSDLAQNNPIEATTGNTVGFENVTECGKVVSMLLAKSSQRYRIQSDTIVSLNLLVEQIVYRLKRHFQDDVGFSPNFTGSLPISSLVSCVNRHYFARKGVVALQETLAQLSSQYRLIEKRLVAKLKTKTPTPLTNLGILLTDTFSEIITTIEGLESQNTELKIAQIELECALNAVTNMMSLMDLDSTFFGLVESVFQRFVYDVDTQNWEDVIDCNLQYLLRTSLAKSEKDKLRAECSSFEELKDISRLEKHLTQVLERISKKMPLETAYSIEEKQQNTPISPEKENRPIGTSFGKASTRLLSARMKRTFTEIPETKNEDF